MAENRQESSSTASKTWGHRWGFADTEFVLNPDRSVTLTGDRYPLCGYRMYDFLPYVEEVLGIELDLEHRRQEIEPKQVPQPFRNESFCRAISEEFDSDAFSFDDSVRLLHSHGQTTADEVFKVLFAKLDRVVDMVFYCDSESAARSVIRLAREHDVCLVPFGGGTSVSSALKLPSEEDRMIVSVDTRRMNQIEWIDRENFRACVQAGITGLQLEQELGAAGFTSGHEPDSLELSTLGGWISTNASGMKKNRYGNIEEIVEKIFIVTPEGDIDQVEPLSRGSIGMQPQTLLFGSEGNLGLITKAVIRIHAKPEVQEYGSLIFPDFWTGTEFLSQLARTSYLPASIRLVDNIQFRFGQALKPRPSGMKALLDSLKKRYLLGVKGFDPGRMAAATILMEGTRAEVDFQRKNINRIARRFSGLAGGSENGRRGYMLTYAIAYIRDFVADYHVIGETFETSVPWSRISQVCEAVSKTAREKHAQYELPGRCYVSYRITQLYHTGVCIYFMYGIYVKGVDDPESVFEKIEHSLRQTILENGGSISHHHGVGKLRKDFMKDTLSPSSVHLLKKLKEATDPVNTFGIRNNVFGDEAGD